MRSTVPCLRGRSVELCRWISWRMGAASGAPASRCCRGRCGPEDLGRILGFLAGREMDAPQTHYFAPTCRGRSVSAFTATSSWLVPIKAERSTAMTTRGRSLAPRSDSVFYAKSGRISTPRAPSKSPPAAVCLWRTGPRSIRNSLRKGRKLSSLLLARSCWIR